MLRRMKITGYKSLADVDVRLERLSVLFGPNATGKSNFLDAVQLLSRIATSRTLKDAFEPPYRGKPLESFTFGPNGIASLLEKKSATFRLEADVELSDAVVAHVERQVREMRRGADDSAPSAAHRGNGNGAAALGSLRERLLRYSVEVEILPSSGILRISDESVAALNEKGEVTKRRNAFLEKMETKGRTRLHLRMEGQAHPTYHDLYLDHSILSTPLYAPHYPHLTALREELSRFFFFYFEPRERMRAAGPVREVRHIGQMGEDLGSFLNTLKRVDERQFRAVEKSLTLLVPSITGIEVGVNTMGEVDLAVKEGELRVPARVMSEGTLRILGLLALGGAKEPPSVIGFEEPENGIHPRRIELVARTLRTLSAKSQLIVTTHSSLVPDLVPERSLFVCRRKKNDTSIEPFAATGELGGIFMRDAIHDALDDESDAPSPSERILRGDFDA